MDRFLRTLSIRRKKRPKIPDTNGGSHPVSWQEDERKVREGTCSFQVKYLGSVEVFESRGIQICEDAIKRLKSSKHKRQRAILYVSGDALRVVDELSKGLLVDQTIEKVSFCAPDRYHSKGFAYICRDGTTRRWLCHGFLAVKETGERLSHAVGCAFAICLEKKQKREREAVTVQFNEDRTSFTRFGSFRQVSLAERLQDPQALRPAPNEDQPATVATTATVTTATATATVSAATASTSSSDKALPAGAIQRPRASADLLERQASFRGFSKLQELVSPFKRNVSLRLNELPSTKERKAHDLELNNSGNAQNVPAAAPEISHSSSKHKRHEPATGGLSNSGFASPAPQQPATQSQPLTATPNGVNNANASLWQTPTIVEEEEPAADPFTPTPATAPVADPFSPSVAAAPVALDPFAAAPFPSNKQALPNNASVTMHHSLTSGSIATAASVSASPSVVSGLSTPARPMGGFSLMGTSASMTPVAPQAVMVTQMGNMMMPIGMVTNSQFGAGGTLILSLTPANTMTSTAPVAPSPAILSARFNESSVPPSASRALFTASNAPNSPTSGSTVDPFDVAWAEKQTTRARLNNPFVTSGQVQNADARQPVEAFKVRL